MRDLPAGWAQTTIGQIADTTLGKMLDKGKSAGDHLVPYLRNSNVQWGRINQDDILTMDIPPEEQEFFGLREGDLLVCEGGEPGRCAIWPGRNEYIAFQKALHRLRPLGGVPVQFIRYLFEYLNLTGVMMQFASGSTIKHLPQEQLRRLPVALPPAEEQRRIVTTLDDQLSRLDRVSDGIRASMLRLRGLTRKTIIDAVPDPAPRGWQIAAVADVGLVDLGRQRHPDWHTGPDMRPYLRVANVFENRIDTSDLMEMDFPPEIFDRFRLAKGDILLNEGQSPELLGRPAMYKGEPPEIAFTNSLIRFRSGPSVTPDWALLVFRRHMHSGRFAREVRITTNIAHLSAGRFKKVEFPVPSLEEQDRIVSQVSARLASINWLVQTLEAAQLKARSTRRALLTEAFTGRLVPQNPADEPADRLLERIAWSRPAKPAGRQKRGIQEQAVLEGQS